MPECHANWDWRSRKETLGEVEASSRAMAMAREAGPNPMQIRSSTEVCGDAFIGLETWSLWLHASSLPISCVFEAIVKCRLD